jgi:uncharacterized membrane protein YqjE
MNIAVSLVALLVLILILWMAYRIGKIILRILVGLLFLGLIVIGIYFVYMQSTH